MIWWDIMKSIKFTTNEIRIIKLWADNVIHGGHWGDGDVIFPDEAITLEKLNNFEENMTFNSRDIDIIVIWADTSTDTPEEEILKNKIDKFLSI